MFFDRFKIRDRYLIIKNFPYPSFERDMLKKYKNKSILNFISVQGKSFFSGVSVSVHTFFLPELVYILTTLPARTHYRSIEVQIPLFHWGDITVSGKDLFTNKSIEV